jgi:tripartite-type tricarboxylate transporter receptor subunit TctC
MWAPLLSCEKVIAMAASLLHRFTASPLHRLTRLFAVASCFVLGAPGALAQKGVPGADYPNRPIRIVVPFTPGGQPDIFTRLIVPGLVESLKQQVIIDNRPGAGGSIGSKMVADAAPDGYTLLSVSSGHTINPVVYKLPYDTLKDFAGVTRTYSAPFLLVAPMSLGVRSVKDLIELAKAKPGQLNFASAGPGSGTHFAGEMLKHSSGIDVVHVPYRGISESLTDITAGRAQFFMAPIGSAAQLVRDGRIRGLGVSSTRRVPALADIPTIAESGLPGFEWDAWGSIFMPAKTPRAIINRWSQEVRRAAGAPDIQKRLHAIGMEAAPTAPEELDGLIKQQMAIVAKLAKTAGVRPE